MNLDKISEILNKNAKKSLIIAIVIIVIIALVVVFTFFNRGGSGSSVNIKDTLTINQPASKYDFSIKVNSVEYNQKINDIFGESDDLYTIVNLTMTLNSGNIPNPLLYGYHLIDSNGNELATANSIIPPTGVDENTLFNEDNLESNKSTTGNLYFKTSSNDIKKLRIQVFTKGIQSTEDDVEYYYINLK